MTKPSSRLLTVGVLLVFALNTLAQQTSTPDNPVQGGVPTVEGQLRFLTGRLALTSDQQAKIKPTLQKLHNVSVRLKQDRSNSRDEHMADVRAWRLKTDKKLREILSENQKKKLDQLEQEPHPELHGDLDEAPPPPPH